MKILLVAFLPAIINCQNFQKFSGFEYENDEIIDIAKIDKLLDWASTLDLNVFQSPELIYQQNRH